VRRAASEKDWKLIGFTPNPKNLWEMENKALEDEFSLQNGDFPLP